jgi:alpha/beta superfamily hydrolase
MQVDFEGPSGRLEGALWDPEGEPLGAAVVCHPHPLHGGTMHNNVVFRTARALQEAGLVVLRFNFRGVGRSEGVHDGEGGEDDDLRAALDHLRSVRPGLPLWAGGFSFGARTSCRVAAAGAAGFERLLLVALPVRVFSCPWLAEVRLPTRVIMAGQDEFGTAAELHAQFPDLPSHITVEEVPLVDHFFTGQLDELQARVRAWAQSELQLSSPRPQP